jgi:dipeptide transport system ATP-binding protein
MTETPIVDAKGLSRYYTVGAGLVARGRTLRAVDDVSFTLARGKTLAVVGESGCGKSTLARLVVGIEPPTAGRLDIDGVEVSSGMSRAAARKVRRTVQMVFQDPYGSLNPRQKVGGILAEPLRINTDQPAASRAEAARTMMARVGLRPEHFYRYPHMFSGGQRQRIAIARALMLNPAVVVADEPVSALDVSIQAQVLNLLMDLQQQLGLAYLFISHDLSVVRHIADEVMVMYLGRAVEIGPRQRIFSDPRHPYTRALLASTPQVDPKSRIGRIVLKGEIPSPLAPPPGCAFHTRCPYAKERCAIERPALRNVNGRQVSCHYAESIG